MAATVWLFAKEFGWTSDYILWGISEAEINQLEHCILINKDIKVTRRGKKAESIIDSILDAT